MGVFLARPPRSDGLLVGALPDSRPVSSCSPGAEEWGRGKEVRGPRGAEENGGGGVVLRPPRVAPPCGAAAPSTLQAERRLSDRGCGGAAPAIAFLLLCPPGTERARP